MRNTAAASNGHTSSSSGGHNLIEELAHAKVNSEGTWPQFPQIGSNTSLDSLDAHHDLSRQGAVDGLSLMTSSIVVGAVEFPRFIQKCRWYTLIIPNYCGVLLLGATTSRFGFNSERMLF